MRTEIKIKTVGYLDLITYKFYETKEAWKTACDKSSQAKKLRQYTNYIAALMHSIKLERAIEKAKRLLKSGFSYLKRRVLTTAKNQMRKLKYSVSKQIRINIF